MREVLKHILCYLILVVLAFNPVLSNARSLIELDRSARQNTRILKRTDTGLIVQNINTPNDKGTSLNKFKKFNVGKAGLIINNGSFVSDSVLGKKVRANPNLTKGKEASTIINQVTSRNETKLLGPTELVGKRANYVLINPNRIICDGCDFINIPRATLTTATPKFKDDELETLNIEGGSILINGNAVNLKGVNQFDLITKTAEIASKIEAEDLNIIAGLAEINYKDNQILNIVDTEEKPEIAIDVKSLGGMYANQIKLIAVNEGVGINSEGEISGSNVYIDANGDVIFGRIKAIEDINITSSAGVFHDADKLASANNINITADNVDLSGAMVKAIDSLNINANDLNIEEELYATNINLNIKDQIDNNSEVRSSNNLVLNTNDLNNGGLIFSNNQMVINSDIIDNKSNKLEQGIKSLNELKITSKEINNEGFIGVLEESENSQLEITSDIIKNKGEIYSAKKAIIKSSDLFNESIINAQEELTINGTNIVNAATVILEKDVITEESATNININSEEDLNKADDLIKPSNETEEIVEEVEENILVDIAKSENIVKEEESIKDVALHSEEDLNKDNTPVEFSNDTEQNIEELEEDILVDASETIKTVEEDLVSIKSKKVTIISENIINKNLIEASSNIKLNSDKVENSGSIISDANLTINTDNLDNIEDAQISSISGNIDIESEFINNNSLISSKDEINIIANEDLVNKNEILSTNVNITSKNIINSGLVQASDNLNITGDIIQNNKVLEGNNAKISTTELNNKDMILGIDSLTINGDKVINDGDIISNQKINITSKELDNNSEIKVMSNNEDQKITIDSQKIDNSGLIISNGELDITTDNIVNTKSGEIVANDNLDIKGKDEKRVDNLVNKGKILAKDTLKIYTDKLENIATIYAARNQINAKIINNQNAKGIRASKSLTINTDKLNNKNGSIGAFSSFDKNAQIASDFTGPAITININDNYVNDGVIESGGAINLTAKNVSNNNKIAAEGDVTISSTSGNIDNAKNAEIISNSKLSLNSNGDVNNSGLISSVGDLTINANNVNNQTAQISTDSNLNIKANNINNNGQSILYATKDINLNIANNLNNNSSDIYSFSNIKIEGASNGQRANKIINNSGRIEVSGNMTLRANQVENNGNAQYHINDEMTLVDDESFTMYGPEHKKELFFHSGRNNRWLDFNKGGYNDPVYINFHNYTPYNANSPYVQRELYQQNYSLKKATTGTILSGSNMTLDTANLNQNKAQINYGSNLNMPGNSHIENNAISLKQKTIYTCILKSGICDIHTGTPDNGVFVKRLWKDGKWINEKEQEVIVSSISGGGTFTFRGKSINNKITLYEKENIDLNKLSITNTSKLTEANLALDKEFLKP